LLRSSTSAREKKKVGVNLFIIPRVGERKKSPLKVHVSVGLPGGRGRGKIPAVPPHRKEDEGGDGGHIFSNISGFPREGTRKVGMGSFNSSGEGEGEEVS